MTHARYRVKRLTAFLCALALALLLLSAAPLSAAERREMPRARVGRRGTPSRTARSPLLRTGDRRSRSDLRVSRGLGSFRSRDRSRGSDRDRFGTFGDRLHFRGLHGIGRLEHRPLGRSSIRHSPFIRHRSSSRVGPVFSGGDSRVIILRGSDARYYTTTRYYGSVLFGADGLFFRYEYPSPLYRHNYRFGHPFGHGVHWWRGHVPPRSGVTVVLKF